MAATPDIERARVFAQEWIDAWNSGSLDRILSHYRDDCEMRSPLIAERGIAEDGVLKGKAQIGAYWASGLAAGPPIHFELVKILCGVGAIAIFYRNFGRKKLVIERLELDDAGLAVKAEALYAEDDNLAV